MIIARYITKEALWTFLAITGILLLIALSNRFSVYLAKAATGELPLVLVFKIVGFFIPELLSYLIPLGFFIAILFSYGRLHADSEMTVLMACGVGFAYLSKLTLMLAFLVMGITAALTLWLVPAITTNREEALSEGAAVGVIQSLLPGRFQTFSEGKLVFYVEDLDSKDNTLKGVFIAEQPDMATKNANGWTLITAEDATIARDDKTEGVYLVFKDGYRYQGMPGTANYTVIKFKEYGRSVPQEMETSQTEAFRMKTSFDLLNSPKAEDQSEFQWRLSLPLSVPILGLLAISLSRVRPRQGRFAKLLPAVVLYILYYNLFTLCKRWVASGILPSWIGVWWIHGLFLILALILLARESGWFWQWRDRQKSQKSKKIEKKTV